VAKKELDGPGATHKIPREGEIILETGRPCQAVLNPRLRCDVGGSYLTGG